MEVPTPKSTLTTGGRGPVYITMLLGTTRMSLPNRISFRLTALAGCTSVTEETHRLTCIHTDHATVTCVAKGGIVFSDAG